MHLNLIMNPLELLISENYRCAESPIWDSAKQILYFNDMNASRVFSYDPKSAQVHELNTGGLNAAGMAFNHKGELVLAGTAGLHLWRDSGESCELISQQQGEALNFNDILADPKGRLYAGTWYWGAEQYEKPGKLYLIDVDGSLRIQDEGIELSNGLGLSPDARTLYYADSSARRIYAYNVDPISGELSNRRIFVNVPRAEGLPDGLTVDAGGFIWSAQWYGSQIVRYDPDGKVERRINVPSAQVASIAFGGPEMDELYITTAGEDWSTSFVPVGYNSSKLNINGNVYRLRAGVRGKQEYIAKLTWKKE